VELTRRELVARGALLAGAVAVEGAIPAWATHRRGRPRSIHCLPLGDRFTPAYGLPGASFAVYSPEGLRLACNTAQGIEIRPRGGGFGAVIAPPGFRIANQCWHPDGRTVLATGPGSSGSSSTSLYAVRADGSGRTRLLTDLPGTTRAGSFSPDGTKVAFTYVDGFVHRIALGDWADAPPRVDNPRALIPFDPRTEQDATRMVHGLAWYETRGFSPDGRLLLFASDRNGGMCNGNSYAMNLSTGSINHITRTDGFAEGGLIGIGGKVLYFGSTRAREAGFMTLFTAPEVPPFLGFVAVPALHDRVASSFMAPVGNGDLIAVDAVTGLKARLIVKREVIVKTAGTGLGQSDHRIVACSMSPDGRDLTIAAIHPGGAGVAVMRRRRSSVPKRAKVAQTPIPPVAQPLEQLLLGASSIRRTVPGRFGGRVALTFSGTLSQGVFEADFTSFSDEGPLGFQGPIRFVTTSGGYTHTADLRRVRNEQDEERGYYRASLRVTNPDTAGELESRSSRFGTLRAVISGGRFAAERRLGLSREKASGLRGTKRCPRPPKRRRRRRRTRS
jgi:hypothetical protein